MSVNPAAAQGFAAGADAYARGRPSYPTAAVDHLVADARPRPGPPRARPRRRHRQASPRSSSTRAPTWSRSSRSPRCGPSSQARAARRRSLLDGTGEAIPLRQPLGRRRHVRPVVPLVRPVARRRRRSSGCCARAAGWRWCGTSATSRCRGWPRCRGSRTGRPRRHYARHGVGRRRRRRGEGTAHAADAVLVPLRAARRPGDAAGSGPVDQLPRRRPKTSSTPSWPACLGSSRDFPEHFALPYRTDVWTARLDLRLAVLDWGEAHRRDLPWRRTRDPWAVLVSELMLQQTQVARVLPGVRRVPRPVSERRRLCRSRLRRRRAGVGGPRLQPPCRQPARGRRWRSRARRLPHHARRPPGAAGRRAVHGPGRPRLRLRGRRRRRRHERGPRPGPPGGTVADAGRGPGGGRCAARRPATRGRGTRR